MIEKVETGTFKRRFPRVFLTGAMRDLPFINKCNVIWPSKLESGIFDFGRSSVAVYFPMRLNLTLSKNEIINLNFKLGTELSTMTTDCRVVRAETRLLVIELFRLSNSYRKTIDSFFTDEVIAQNTHYIPSRFYAPEQSFTHWFHGPMDTNLFVWQQDKAIRRVVLELGSKIFEWNIHGFFMGESRDTLSYATEDYAYYSGTLVQLNSVGVKSDQALRLRYFISTLTSTHPAIKDVSIQIGH